MKFRVLHRLANVGVAKLSLNQLKRRSGLGPVYSRRVPMVVDRVGVNTSNPASSTVFRLDSASGKVKQPVGTREILSVDQVPQYVTHPRRDEDCPIASTSLGPSDERPKLRLT